MTMARWGKVMQGSVVRCETWLGNAGRCGAKSGLVRFGFVLQDIARQSDAGQGYVWFSVAVSGKAWQGFKQ